MGRTEWILLMLCAGGALMFALGKGARSTSCTNIRSDHRPDRIMILFIPASPLTWKECRTEPYGARFCCSAAH